jgi:hypothetical protein
MVNNPEDVVGRKKASLWQSRYYQGMPHSYKMENLTNLFGRMDLTQMSNIALGNESTLSDMIQEAINTPNWAENLEYWLFLPKEISCSPLKHMERLGVLIENCRLQEAYYSGSNSGFTVTHESDMVMIAGQIMVGEESNTSKSSIKTQIYVVPAPILLGKAVFLSKTKYPSESWGSSLPIPQQNYIVVKTPSWGNKSYTM